MATTQVADNQTCFDLLGVGIKIYRSTGGIVEVLVPKKLSGEKRIEAELSFGVVIHFIVGDNDDIGAKVIEHLRNVDSFELQLTLSRMGY